MILASGSPRRKEILEMVGYKIKIIPSMCDENTNESSPGEIVKALSKLKAKSVACNFPQELVLGADTVVYADGVILGKPKDEDEASRMLSLLSGNTHEVYTGVCLCYFDTCISFFEKTLVTMYDNKEKMIWDYIKTGDPMDKAGAYGIQGGGAVLIKEIHGDYFNVMGLPIARTVREIEKLMRNE